MEDVRAVFLARPFEVKEKGDNRHDEIDVIDPEQADGEPFPPANEEKEVEEKKTENDSGGEHHKGAKIDHRDHDVVPQDVSMYGKPHLSECGQDRNHENRFELRKIAGGDGLDEEEIGTVKEKQEERRDETLQHSIDLFLPVGWIGEMIDRNEKEECGTGFEKGSIP